MLTDAAYYMRDHVMAFFAVHRLDMLFVNIPSLGYMNRGYELALKSALFSYRTKIQKRGVYDCHALRGSQTWALFGHLLANLRSVWTSSCKAELFWTFSRIPVHNDNSKELAWFLTV